MEAATPVVTKNSPMRRLASNVLIYIITLVVVLVSIYFIYRYITQTPSLQKAEVLSTIVEANKPESSRNNIKIPFINEGGEFTLNFWICITGYNYRQGSRKHLVEIYSTGTTNNSYSTILVALGAFKPTLMVRAHTAPSVDFLPSGNHNYGITDCSGGNPEDCSGGDMNGFNKLTDTNYTPQNNVNDNTLYIKDINQFFKPMQIDEPTSTCDVKDLPLSKYVNICITMVGKTLDVYQDGRLVKTCVYKNFFKVDNARGIALRYLQGTNQSGFDGYFSRLQVFNEALNPDEIYKIYMAGHTGSSPANDPVSFIKYIFSG